MRAGTSLLVIGILLAGCVQSTPETAPEANSVILDEDRPDPKFGQVVTGPAVGPDLNATTESPPRLVEGEWWRIRFENSFADDAVAEVVRVVANVSDEGYVMGMPHEGWYKEAIAYHAPAFGDVGKDLSYFTHNELFEPVRFPLEQGATWLTAFATASYRATVESADNYLATIVFQGIRSNPQPTDPVTDQFGLTSDGGTMRLFYDARQHEIVRMESPIGSWEVIEHGYDFQGWVTVPRGEHTAIDYGNFGPVTPGQPILTRTIEVKGGFNRLTMMHAVFGITPGQYRIVSKPPNEPEMRTEITGTQTFALKFYESNQPDGVWTQEDWAMGGGATYSMGIAYHQYDIRLPDGARRADHAHEVIR
jgi:hypothetical protein